MIVSRWQESRLSVGMPSRLTLGGATPNADRIYLDASQSQRLGRFYTGNAQVQGMTREIANNAPTIALLAPIMQGVR